MGNYIMEDTPVKKIMIATPAYSGRVNAQYAISLSDTRLALLANKIGVDVQIAISGSLLVAERNRIVELFWQSDCTHLLCIDSDLGWPAEAVIAMIQKDKEFIAGVYPSRKAINDFTFRPCFNPNGSLVTDGNLIKVEYIPAGFMMISKSAIEKMRDKFPELHYSPKHDSNQSESAYCFFDTEVFEGEFWGEDYVFCRRASQASVDIWVDPYIQFDHDGTLGMLAQIFTDDPTKALKANE